MSIDALDLAEGFDDPDLDRWRAEVDRVLGRGKGDLDRAALDTLFDKALVTTTYDGLRIAPLYAPAGDVRDAPAPPGQAPYVRGTRPLGSRRFGWQVRQAVRVTDADPAIAVQVLDELERGTTQVLLRLHDAPVIDVDLLDTVLDGIHLELVPIVLDAGDRQAEAVAALEALWARRGTPAPEAQGVLGLDPLARWLRNAGTTDRLGDERALVEAVIRHRSRPQVVVAVVDAALVHEAGGGDVDELAYGIAAAVHLLRVLLAAGVDLDDAADAIEFRFAAPPDQFTTIAKFRAARRLWQRVVEAAGGSPSSQRQRQHASPSIATMSRYDIWVNLLRSSVGCFAAGVGGADSVTVQTHDDLVLPGGSDLGRRMARNAQLILIEESNLAKVVDMAGGSWYVEDLTDQLARAAWARFQAFEAAGGIVAAAEAGMLQDGIDVVRDARDRAVATRRHPLTGVSEFPDIGEDAPAPVAPDVAPDGPIRAIRPRRHAQPVEDLRARADERERDGRGRPEVFLLAMGTPAIHTARSTFAKNLFEVGGIRAIVPSGFDTVAAAVDAYVESGAPLACICSNDAGYEAHAVALVDALTALDRPPRRIYLAGRPGDLADDLDAAGLDEAVVAGGDILDTLRRAHDLLDREIP
jgi:methylmalonyl-CoA mutase